MKMIYETDGVNLQNITNPIIRENCIFDYENKQTF